MTSQEFKQILQKEFPKCQIILTKETAASRRPLIYLLYKGLISIVTSVRTKEDGTQYTHIWARLEHGECNTQIEYNVFKDEDLDFFIQILHHKENIVAFID